MNELQPLLLDLTIGCAAGIVLGAIFFGGLWVATQRLVTSQRPALLALSSFVGRMGVLGFGMFLMAQSGAVALISAACGILAVRQWMIHQVRSGSEGAS